MLFKRVLHLNIRKLICLGLLTGLNTPCGANQPISPPAIFTNNQALYDHYPNAVLYFYGITGSNPLVRMFQGEFHRWPEHVQSIEYSRTLNRCNVVRRFFYPIVGVVQLNANFSYRVGSNQHNIYEFNPYIGFRWANFYWNDWVNTSFAIGEGISYDTSVPSLEKRSNENTKRLLNYLMLEATFALPTYPQLQVVARIHHRSGAYGLYRAGNTGSNNVGLALRYMFN